MRNHTTKTCGQNLKQNIVTVNATTQKKIWTRPKQIQNIYKNIYEFEQSRLAATTCRPDPHRSTSRDATSQNRTCKDNASSRVPIAANPDERKLRNGTSTARFGHVLPILPGNFALVPSRTKIESLLFAKSLPYDIVYDT